MSYKLFVIRSYIIHLLSCILINRITPLTVYEIFRGLYTFRYKQSSLMLVFGFHICEPLKSPNMVSGVCIHAFGRFIAFNVEVQGCFFTGGLNLRFTFPVREKHCAQSIRKNIDFSLKKYFIFLWFRVYQEEVQRREFQAKLEHYLVD